MEMNLLDEMATLILYYNQCYLELRDAIKSGSIEGMIPDKFKVFKKEVFEDGKMEALDGNVTTMRFVKWFQKNHVKRTNNNPPYLTSKGGDRFLIKIHLMSFREI